MKIKTILAVVFVLAVVLTACAPQAAEVPTTTTEPTMAASPPAEATNTGEAATATAGVPVTGEVTINVSESTEFGPILVDDQGLSLYLFMNDTQGGESSACNDDCATEWPPLLTQGSPVAGEGVDSTLLGTITREDGSMQVTYNGWPLHHFDEDTTLGDTKGQGMEGLWFLVTPAGEPVKP